MGEFGCCCCFLVLFGVDEDDENDDAVFDACSTLLSCSLIGSRNLAGSDGRLALNRLRGSNTGFGRDKGTVVVERVGLLLHYL